MNIYIVCYVANEDEVNVSMRRFSVASRFKEARLSRTMSRI